MCGAIQTYFLNQSTHLEQCLDVLDVNAREQSQKPNITAQGARHSHFAATLKQIRVLVVIEAANLISQHEHEQGELKSRKRG
jgi:hypothetical protein